MAHPGTASWNSTTALSSSAMLRMLVPRTLIGPVVPICGIGSTKMGQPAFAMRMCASVISASCCSGAMVQFVADQIGRSRSGAPAIASSSSIITGAWSGRAHLVLQVLARVLERDARHLEVADARVDVAGRDRRPGEVDLGDGVVQAHHRGEVGLGALVPLAGEVVQHVRRGAVARVEHAAVADRAVVGGVAPGEQDLPRDLPQAALDRAPTAAWPAGSPRRRWRRPP